MMTSVRFVVALAVAALVQPAAAQPAERSIVPIHAVEITPEGIPRFSIDVRVGGETIETGLDTGSVGLRLLPRAVARANVTPTGEPQIYRYSSGVVLLGPVATGRVRIGGSERTINLQAVRKVSCRIVDGVESNCPAKGLDPEDYGLMGSGHPGQGFAALIGTRLQDSGQPNPLVALGVRRWIVHLPRPGEDEGALILNPEPREMLGFRPLQPTTDGAGLRDGTVAGCTMVAAPGAKRICGPTLWDSGAPSIAVSNFPRPQGWKPGVKARMGFAAGDGGPPVALGFRIGDSRQRTAATFERNPQRAGVFVSAGVMPYYAYDMLYDAERNQMAVRPRPPAAGGPIALP